MEQILALVANHMRFKDVEQMRSSTLKRFVRLPHFDEHLELHRLDCLSSHRQLQSYEFVRRFLANTPPEQVHPPRLLTGDDLKQMGYAPGPLFSEILQSLEDAQLEGQVQDKEAAVRFVSGRFRHSGRRSKESSGATSGS
jgi:poly(A) polymerase